MGKDIGEAFAIVMVTLLLITAWLAGMAWLIYAIKTVIERW